MGKKTPSASSESVVTSSSSPPEASDSRNNSIVSEADTTTSTDTVDGGKGAKKLGLIKRMSLRRSEKKKDKEKEKEKKEEMEKEKAREKEEKAKGKEKVKEKDKKKDKKKDKDKANEKDKHREDGQKKTVEDIYTKISMDDFEAKQVEFKLWMLEQQNGSIDTLKPSKVKSFFKKFVKEWNKKRLPQRYYWSSEETPPPSRAGSRFSFAEDVQTPDFLNFPAAPVDLSNDDVDSSDDIERSGSFSTFGKTQKPEGLNDEITPTLPKRPLLSTSPLTCPSLSPQSPVLLTYEHSPGIINGTLKERYAITPDNNNIKLNESSEVCNAEESNYTCMENDVLPGEELKVTEILERAIQDDLLPSGELTPIAEEESSAHDTKHVVQMQTVVEALQPVMEDRDVTVEGQPKVSQSETSVDTTWKVVDSKTETGQITFSGLPPPPKEWKMDPMGLTHTILPTARPVSQERTVTTAEVVTHPDKMSEETTKVIKTTTITTVEQITSGGKTVEAEQVSRVATSPTVKSPVIAVHDNQVLPSPVQQGGRTEKIEAQEVRGPVLQEPPVIHVTRERETGRNPTVTSSTTVTREQIVPSPSNQGITVIGLEKLELKPSVITEQSSPTTSPQPSSVKFVAQELKSPTMKVEQPVVVVQQTSVVSNAPTSSSVEMGKVSERDIPVAVCPPKSEAKTVTIQPRSVSIPETSHVTLAHQEMHSPVSKPEVLLPEQPCIMGTELNYTRVSPDKEVHVMSTSVDKQQDRRDVIEVSSSRQNVETSSLSYTVTSPQVETTTVDHIVVTRSTPQVLQTQETKNTNPIYREHAAVTSHIPRPTSKGAHLPLVLQESTTVTKASVSPTNNVTRESIRAVRPAPPPPETKHKVTTVERRTVSTSSASPRNSTEIKHDVTESSAERKRGPALSPIIVSASTVPMLFQDAMKPVELDSTHSSKVSTSPPKSAPMRSPRSPDKPKPAPRPSSLRSPTSPGSHIPVAVKAEPVSPAKSPRQEAVPPPKAPRPQSFRSSTQLIMPRALLPHKLLHKAELYLQLLLIVQVLQKYHLLKLHDRQVTCLF
ncbi:mucin-2-like isoform X2 [Liolophura sinensis]|uniref:mucin-2-like isoform X2 n=1 Tax=Liolophura sinensis TaxID=3198878 RepID=UPI00315949FE